MSADTEGAATARVAAADIGENGEEERGAGKVGAAGGAHVKELESRSRWQWLETPLEEPPRAAARKRQGASSGLQLIVGIGAAFAGLTGRARWLSQLSAGGEEWRTQAPGFCVPSGGGFCLGR